jgi:hypothetical protein
MDIVTFLSKIKPWLGFLFDLLAGQEVLRKTPWIDEVWKKNKAILALVECRECS